MVQPEVKTMTDRKRAAFKKLIARHTRETTATRETARASLVRQGIYTQDGRLAPEYTVKSRGEGRDAAQA